MEEFHQGKKQEIDAGIKEVVSRGTGISGAPWQPVVVIMAVDPRLGRFDDNIMIVEHPPAFCENRGQQAKEDSKRHDQRQGLIIPDFPDLDSVCAQASWIHS